MTHALCLTAVGAPGLQEAQVQWPADAVTGQPSNCATCLLLLSCASCPLLPACRLVVHVHGMQKPFDGAMYNMMGSPYAMLEADVMVYAQPYKVCWCGC